MRSETEYLISKSYDWHQEHGLAFVNKRKMEKTALVPFKDETPAHWVSKYGSVTLNQYGREFPLSGMNEKGLVVEIMWLDYSEYPQKDSRQSVNELQWVQYQLDNFSSVAEVVEHINDVRIRKIYANVHFMVCDQSGECATVEFLKGLPVLHTGRNFPLPVLANDSYNRSMDYAQGFNGFGGMLPISMTSSDSLDRFVRAASQVLKEVPSLSTALKILTSVKNENSSVWNVIYQPNAETISFRTISSPELRTFSTSGFDYSCLSEVKMLDLEVPISGTVTDRFESYTSEANEWLVEKSFTYIPLLPVSLKKAAVTYPHTTFCRETGP